MESTLRDDLLGGSNKARSKIVTLPGPKQTQVEIRQQTYEVQKAIRDKATIDGNWDAINYSMLGIIESVYYPNTDDAVFKPDDLNALMGLPPQAWLEFLRSEVQEYLYFSTEEIEELKKKSEAPNELFSGDGQEKSE